MPTRRRLESEPVPPMLGIPPGHHVVELDQQVDGPDPALRTRFLWRARWRRGHLEHARHLPSYRWEVHQADDGWWEVLAMQNILVPNHEHREIDARRRRWWNDLMDDVAAVRNGKPRTTRRKR